VPGALLTLAGRVASVLALAAAGAMVLPGMALLLARSMTLALGTSLAVLL
jgi:hypothetical protein